MRGTLGYRGSAIEKLLERMIAAVPGGEKDGQQNK
jgi:hypothetical protein